MPAKISQTESLGFCTGVRRAIDIITSAAREHGGVETLGALVHNKEVVRKLDKLGVRIVDDVASVKGKVVVISAHGVGPEVVQGIEARGLAVLDTTCAFVRRAQAAAKKLAADGFFLVVYGEGSHPEVKGILGWGEGHGLATLDAADLKKLPYIPRRLGLLSQTTQIPADFIAFAKQVLDLAFTKDSEIRVVDTICHETRRRQADTLKMARGSDLALVVGGRNSANTRRLYELCSTITETRLIETAAEIEPGWLAGRQTIGLTAGASTDDETIRAVRRRLAELA